MRGSAEDFALFDGHQINKKEDFENGKHQKQKKNG